MYHRTGMTGIRLSLRTPQEEHSTYDTLYSSPQYFTLGKSLDPPTMADTNTLESSSSSAATSTTAAAAPSSNSKSSNSSNNNNKENSANAAAASSDEQSSSLKRPASEEPAAADAAAASGKRSKPSSSTSTTATATESPADNNDKTTNDSDAPLDLAVTLGYKPGDRIEVHWEVETDSELIVKWWGASLKPFDGRTTDGVAIRTLHYDTCKELGFENPSDEDVVFLGQDLLVSPDSTTQLNYRKEGEEDVYWLNEEDMDEQLNTILMGALAKNQAVWQNLPAAQQAIIAEKIKTKKEQLLEVLKSKKEVITSSSIKDILKETFGATPSSAS
jgi:hypothetical protein